jgi:integrin beta 3
VLDIEKFIEGVHGYLKREFEPIFARLKAVEERATVPGKDGADGLNGKDGADGLNGKDGADGLNGKDGADGLNGKDGADGLNGKDGADGLNGKDGADGLNGKDGADGLNGKDGADGINGKDGADGINGKDGADGINGTDGADGLNGKDGADGLNGKDGADGLNGTSVTVEEVRGLFEGEIAKWALEFERRAQDVLQKAIDHLPVPLDGKDGLGFDNLEVIQTDERNVILRFVGEGGTKDFSCSFPVLIDRGTYKPDPDQPYQKGDCVTYGGSLWISQKDNPETKPGTGSDFRLAVKCGRDAKV